MKSKILKSVVCVNVACNYPSLTQKAQPPSFTLRKRNKGTRRGARRRNTRTRSSTNTRRTRRYQEPLGPVRRLVAAKCRTFTDFPFSSTRRRNRSSTKAKGRSQGEVARRRCWTAMRRATVEWDRCRLCSFFNGWNTLVIYLFACLWFLLHCLAWKTVNDTNLSLK